MIEDDQNKIKQIVDELNNVYPSITITRRNSFQSGLKEILGNRQKYKLLILDMSMPTFDISNKETGGRLRPFAGKDILRQMYRKNIFIPTVVVTQFENFGELIENVTLSQLNIELKESFSNIYMGTVYYNAAQDNWKQDLIKYIDKYTKESEQISG
ncbi:hypothetical protein [Paenibacillus agricola]|nr:hypothetical protein [Paenibacillus agricola]